MAVNRWFFVLALICQSGFYACGLELEELSIALKEWKLESYRTPVDNPLSGSTNYYNPKFYEILSQGPEIAAPLMLEYQNGNQEAAIFFPKLFKMKFDSSFDRQQRVWLFHDYPGFVYYPPGLHGQNKNCDDGIWDYWWRQGRKQTPEIFQQKYAAYEAAKQSGDDQSAAGAYLQLQNMGIIILPDLLDKIMSGDDDLIPMFSLLAGRSDLRIAAECNKWWTENKYRYNDIQRY